MIASQKGDSQKKALPFSKMFCWVGCYGTVQSPQRLVGEGLFVCVGVNSVTIHRALNVKLLQGKSDKIHKYNSYTLT